MGSDTAAPRTISLLKRRREQAGVAQQALAERVGVSRQALTAIEAGRQVPSTSLALQLARALGCRVEDLFTLAPSDSIEVELAPSELAGPRVLLAKLRGRWVAHHVHDAAIAADGVLLGDGGAAQPLDELGALSKNVLVAGCAPLLGALADGACRRSRDVRVRWIYANSRDALDLLERDLVHVAGLHLGGDGDHTSLVRKRFRKRRMMIVHLTRWRQGLVVAKGNPLGVREAGDLLRSELRLARREEGAGASALLCSVVRGAALPAGPLARSHDEIARLVRSGAADVGVAIESAALSLGLDFVPLAEERFDLVLCAESASEEPLRRMLDALEDSAFRTEARALPGYDTSMIGRATRIG